MRHLYVPVKRCRLRKRLTDFDTNLVSASFHAQLNEKTRPETVRVSCFFEWPSFSLQDSMLPAIPFTIWLVILCGVWSQRSHVSQTGPIVGRSGSADLESLESCNGYQMDHFEYDEQQLPRENSSGDLKPDFSDPFLPWLVCFSMISCWWLATGLVEGKIMQILKPSWLARTKKNGGSGFRGRFWNQSTAFVSPAVGKLTPFGESPRTI